MFTTDELTAEYINSLPQLSFTGRIQVISQFADLDNILKELMLLSAVGFDTESRPSFTKGQSYPISLLQIATSRNVYIIQIQKTGFTDSLNAFLASNTEKIGVGLKDDVRKLKDERDFTPNAIVDLSEIARSKGYKKSSLRALSACFLKKRIVKSSQKTNWAREHLTDKQLRYAATDAWACLLIRPFLDEAPNIDIPDLT